MARVRIGGAHLAFEGMGRTTAVPRVHTNQAGVDGSGDLMVSYAANAMVASLQQTVIDPDTGVAQVRKQTFGLDGTDRVSTIKGYADGVQRTETLNHYDSSDDSPAWTQTKTRPDASTAWTTTWNRYLSGLSGSLAIDVDSTGRAVLQLANLHGDIVATTTLGQAGIDSYTEADEYGQAKAEAGRTARYGWLGTHQRDTSAVGGLTLMGVRLYLPATGRFLSVDPVAGGNDNSYTYPADPTNGRDLDGRCGCKRVRSDGWGGGLGGPIRGYSMIDRLGVATGGRNVVVRVAIGSKRVGCAVRYCFGNGHGMGGPYIHTIIVSRRGPQSPTTRPMTAADARIAYMLLRLRLAKLGSARGRRAVP